MGKLKPFDKQQTEWLGLWYHPESYGFTSEALNLSDLREFKGRVRLYVRKNKFYQKDSNRPNYCFCLKESSALENDKLVEIIKAEILDLDEMYISCADAARLARSEYDGPYDPCDVYTTSDFEQYGETLQEILNRKIEEQYSEDR
jgi:hypothetical protein